MFQPHFPIRWTTALVIVAAMNLFLVSLLAGQKAYNNPLKKEKASTNLKLQDPLKVKVEFPVLGLAFSPDGRNLACVGTELGQRAPNSFAIQSAASIFDLPSQKVVFEVRPQLPPNFGGRGFTRGGARYRGAFSPDGKRFAWVGTNNDHSVYIHNFPGGSKGLGQPGQNRNQGSAVCFSPDGKILASSLWRGEVFLWNPETGKQIKTLNPELKEISAMVFSPDGQFLACAGRKNDFALLDPGTGKIIRKWQHAGKSYPSMAFSPDGKVLATACSKEVKLWEVATGKLIREVGEQVASVAYSPDGRVLAMGSRDHVQLWDTITNSMIGQLPGGTNTQTLAFSPNGKYLAASGARTGIEAVLVWNLRPLGVRPLPTKQLSQKELDKLWADLEGQNAAAAYQAIYQLAASPKQAVPFLKSRLKPAQAPPKANLQRIQQLISNLDNQQFIAREQATLALKKIGQPALPLLRNARKNNPSPETTKRIDILIKALEEQPIPPDELQGLRAVQALELADTSTAKEILQILGKGSPAARLTQEAQAALERIQK